MQKTHLENLVRQQISDLVGDDFQDFVTELMYMRLGTEGFTTLRKSKDGGADGIILAGREIMACWGPTKEESSKLKKKFEKKMRADHASYQKHWEADYPKWKVATNRQPSPDETKFVNSLKKDSSILGLDGLTHIIMNDLCSAKFRRICEILRIDKEQLGQDFIRGFLGDILASSNKASMVPYKPQMTLPDKIDLNFLPSEIHSIQDEVAELMDTYFGTVENCLSEFNDTERSRIKSSIRTDYNQSFGTTTSDKINYQTSMYLHKYATQDDAAYRTLIRAVLFYEFEQCHIGMRTSDEAKGYP